MSSPIQRSLKLLREEGYLCWIVEYTVPKTFIKRDLWGWCDVLALRDIEILAVQVTSYSNVSARIKKIEESETVDAVRRAGIRIEVHGWHKPKGKHRYVVRRVDVT